jgi:hypothetical protein
MIKKKEDQVKMSNKTRTLLFLFLGFGTLSAVSLTNLACSKCGLFPDVNVTAPTTTGTISIEVRGLPFAPAGGSTVFRSISFDGRLLSGGGETGLSTFHLAKTFEISTNSINPQPVVREVGLKTGNWEVRVVSDSWSATGNGVVTRDGTRTFIFTHNRSNVVVK